MKFIRTKRGLLFGGLLLAVVAGLVWRSVQPSDQEQRIARYRAAGLPTTLAELDAWYPPVPDAENAIVVFQQAWQTYDRRSPAGGVRVVHYPPRGATWPEAMLDGVRREMNSNAIPLARMHAALQLPQSRNPYGLSGNFSAVIAHHNLVMRLTNACSRLDLEARWAAETGAPEQAAAALLAELGVAHALEAQPLLFGNLNRYLVDDTALASAECVLSRTPLPEISLQGLQQAFALAEATNHLGRACAGMRCFVLREVGKPSDHAFEWADDHLPLALARMANRLYEASGTRNRDVAAALDHLDELAALADRPRSEMAVRLRHWEAALARLKSGWGWVHPLYLGTFERDIKGVSQELQNVATLRCAQAAMAIERWRMAHGGALPASLTELVPSCLTAVPEDPMDGKPLKFRALSPGYVVYSLGEDGVDDGGKERVSGSGVTNRWDYTFTVAR